MANVIRSNMRTYIASVLREDIASGKFKPGECLPPIKTLAVRFGTSISPVHQAFAELEAEGLVVRRVGAGTFVTDRRPIGDPAHVAMFADIGAHLFGELAGMVLNQLHRLRVYPVTINADHENAEDLLRNAVPAARLVIIVGGALAPDMLGTLSLKGKTVIGVTVPDGEAADTIPCKVMVDHAAGGRLVAEHLRAGGHRRVLMLGTGTMIDEKAGRASPFHPAGMAFGRLWTEWGGTVQVLASEHVAGEGDPRVVPARFRAAFSGPKPPTAVFGLRDFEAWQAQDILQSAPRGPLRGVEVVGYGNTPWSQAARPPISTVDWNLAAVATEACRMISAALTGSLTVPECRRIEPVFIDRSGAATHRP